MKSILLTLLVLSAVPGFAAESSKKAEVQSPASQELTVGVKGMVCAFCAQGIEKKFKAENAVESVQVSLENKFVKLKFKEGQKISNEKITEILKDAGYEADFKQ
jgi:periplasmic mercuric ion binding protein